MTPRYAQFYCEENVWFLLAEGDLVDAHAVFITNDARSVAMWSQRASPRDDGMTLWDYHVVALAQDNGWHVHDLDSTAGCPVPLAVWLRASFPFAGALPEDLEPRFRVVRAADLFATFRTDRSHMRATDSSWLASPPPWPALSDHSNLDEFLDPARPEPGVVLDINGLLDRFAHG